jgi:hypothetical protein
VLTSSMQKSGTLVTGIPAAPAAARSIMSTPMPYREITLHEVSVSIRAASIVANCTSRASAPAVVEAMPLLRLSAALTSSMSSPDAAKTSSSMAWSGSVKSVITTRTAAPPAARKAACKNWDSSAGASFVRHHERR